VRYIQLIESDSSHPAREIRQALDDWLAAARGERTLQMAIVAADHERPNHYWELLEFPSEEEPNRSASWRRQRPPTIGGRACSMASRRSITSTSWSTSRVEPTQRKPVITTALDAGHQRSCRAVLDAAAPCAEPEPISRASAAMQATAGADALAHSHALKLSFPGACARSSCSTRPALEVRDPPLATPEGSPIPAGRTSRPLVVPVRLDTLIRVTPRDAVGAAAGPRR
jgi:hypothetical protein